MKTTPRSLLGESSMKCPKCGYENQPDSLACGLCAELLKGKTTVTPGPSSGAEGAGASQEPDWTSFGAPSGPPFCFESGKMSYAMPKACVCCLGPYLDELPISASVTKHDGGEEVEYTTTWSFPFCLDCSGHVKGDQKGWYLGLGLAILGFAVICGIAGPSKMGGIEWAFALGAAAVGLGVGKGVGIAVFPKVGPRCAAMSTAVTCSGPHNGAYKWMFKNPVYGQAFAEMNRF